jgi:hypothetical protein
MDKPPLAVWIFVAVVAIILLIAAAGYLSGSWTFFE